MSILSISKNSNSIESQFITRFSDLRTMYEASMAKEWTGLGVVKKTYCFEEFHDELEEIAGFVDDDTFDKVRVIACDPSKHHSIAESYDAHPMHTDASFADTQLERFMLHFKHIDDNHGGVSTFMPVQWILDEIPYKYKRALEMAEVTYARLDSAGIAKAARVRILNWKSATEFVFRWRYDDKVRPLVVNSGGFEAEAAIEWVKEFIENKKPITYAAQRDETILVDNCTFLHGRTPLSPASSRVVWRAWIR